VVNDSVKHRLDIEGLRGIAVAMVVLFHAGVPGTSFGFWGVDMFLVISGFLITTTIVKDIDANQFRYGDFLARRIRRLMPAATLVILATMLGVFAVGSPLDWAGVGRDAMVGATYLTNIYAAFVGVSYFNEGASFQPLIHLWSLGLEEQFYVVWPLILVVAARLFGRSGIVWVMALTILVSLGLSVVVSPIAPIKAFFLLPTRMWEFAAGGILGLTTFSPSRGHATAFVGLGGALFVLAIALLTPQTPLPGALTIAPVAGTALVILAGRNGSRHGFSTTLENPALRFVGRISYSLYLLHWPVITLMRPFLPNSAFSTFGLIAFLVGIAWLSLHLVETPWRVHPRLTQPSKTIAFGATLVVVTCGPAWILRNAKSSADVAPFIAVRMDKTRYSGCEQTPCVVKRGVTGTVLIVGDSHAMEWVPAIEAALDTYDVSILYSGTHSCPSVPIRVSNPDQRGAQVAVCDSWQDALPVQIQSLSPDIVVVANFEGYFDGWFRSEIDKGDGPRAWAGATETLMNTINKAGANALFVLDHQQCSENPIRCHTRRFRNRRDCLTLAPRSSDEQAARHLVHELALQYGAEIIDNGDIGDALQPSTFRDKHHITRTFSASQDERFSVLARMVDDLSGARSPRTIPSHRSP
jgi:peptidoglycan/LPS O-acetylase OafA/YrhL